MNASGPQTGNAQLDLSRSSSSSAELSSFSYFSDNIQGTSSSSDEANMFTTPPPPSSSLILHLPSTPDFQIESLDQKYLTFFTILSSLLAYSNLFPTIVQPTFSLATQSSTLLHTVLAISSQIADRSLIGPLHVPTVINTVL